MYICMYCNRRGDRTHKLYDLNKSSRRKYPSSYCFFVPLDDLLKKRYLKVNIGIYTNFSVMENGFIIIFILCDKRN